jgi:large subunit ribosomal protein L28
MRTKPTAAASSATFPLAVVGAAQFMQNLVGWSNSGLLQPLQVRHRSNRSRRGLYDGKDIGSGNNVSFSMRHTRRKFRPNVHIKRVYSEILDAMIPFHLTTSALRSIDKAGGLDNYLLTSEYVKEGEGLKIKKAILKRLKNQAYFARKAAEREADSAGPSDPPKILQNESV